MQLKFTREVLIIALMVGLLGGSQNCFALSDENYLSLPDYLCQVSEQHLGIKGSKKIARGAKKRANEAHLLTSPALFGEGEYSKDVYNPTFSPIQGNETKITTGKMGLSQVTPYGIQGKMYYSFQHQTYSGTSPNFVTNTDFFSSSPVVEMDLSLWRNFAGRETRATAALIDAQARVTHYAERFKIKQLLAQAENTYWRLALARRVVAIQLDSLERAKRIKQWTTERRQLRLAENADLLQAEAAIDLRQLDLQTARAELKLAEQAFNTMRGISCPAVYEQLMCFNDVVLTHMQIPIQPNLRDNVKAAEQQKKAAIANARLGIEKNKPELHLFASYAFNGRNPDMNEALNESFSPNYPSTAVGLRLQMPLDYGSLSRAKSGYRQEIRGAEYQYQRQLFEDCQLWNELLIKLNAGRRRLSIASCLENIQFKKMCAERQRHVLGKTTTYQVLLFEQDYANAQISKLMIQAEILSLYTQLKTFGECKRSI